MWAIWIRGPFGKQDQLSGSLKDSIIGMKIPPSQLIWDPGANVFSSSLMPLKNKPQRLSLKKPLQTF
jgi:hypothetical protein